MKSKGHIYMANLILEELKTKDNLFIDYNGVLEEYEVPDMIKETGELSKEMEDKFVQAIEKFKAEFVKNR